MADGVAAVPKCNAAHAAASITPYSLNKYRGLECEHTAGAGVEQERNSRRPFARPALLSHPATPLGHSSGFNCPGYCGLGFPDSFTP